jgi:carboxypeptidase family protein
VGANFKSRTNLGRFFDSTKDSLEVEAVAAGMSGFGLSPVLLSPMTSRLARFGSFLWIGILFSCLTVNAQSQPPAVAKSPEPAAAPAGQLPGQQATGSINGSVVDATGAVVIGARVTLTRADRSPAQEVLSGSAGRFSFANLLPGAFQITVTASTFAPQTFSAVLQPGQAYETPPVVLALGAANVVIQVGASQTQVAQEQIKAQEKQRVLAVVPNFYVTYVPDPAPLNAKQKFGLAWKQTIDPVSFVLSGALAGFEQWQDLYPGYGQGAEGFGKRFGASYADLASSTFFGSAIFPSLLKQDPRYFYKGTGSKRSRALHAVASAFICRGDNKRWQPNYSSLLGTLAASGLSNAYYPEKDRGVALTFENTAIGTGGNAVINLLQEFVVRRMTPKASKADRGQSHPANNP